MFEYVLYMKSVRDTSSYAKFTLLPVLEVKSKGIKLWLPESKLPVNHLSVHKYLVLSIFKPSYVSCVTAVVSGKVSLSLLPTNWIHNTAKLDSELNLVNKVINTKKQGKDLLAYYF